MSKLVRGGAVALALAASLACTTTADASITPAGNFPAGPMFLATYALAYGFCTALAFGKQTEAGLLGPAARLEAAKDCLIPSIGIAKYAHRTP